MQAQNRRVRGRSATRWYVPVNPMLLQAELDYLKKSVVDSSKVTAPRDVQIAPETTTVQPTLRQPVVEGPKASQCDGSKTAEMAVSGNCVVEDEEEEDAEQNEPSDYLAAKKASLLSTRRLKDVTKSYSNINHTAEASIVTQDFLLALI